MRRHSSQVDEDATQNLRDAGRQQPIQRVIIAVACLHVIYVLWSLAVPAVSEAARWALAFDLQPLALVATFFVILYLLLHAAYVQVVRILHRFWSQAQPRRTRRDKAVVRR